MKQQFQLVLLIVAMLGGSVAYGQRSADPMVKKPRTLEDYKASTLAEILAADAGESLRYRPMAKYAALSPFRVRVIHTASARPLSPTNSDALTQWVQCCAGNPDHYTKGYVTEMQFDENGTSYWLAVQNSVVADLQELKVGEAVDLFLIRLNPPGSDGKARSVLLVEKFQKAKSDDDPLQSSLNWIKSNLPSYTKKDLKVEVTGPCQLSITDSSSSAGVSKAVFWIPLSDLDPSKVSVESHQASDVWALWLHTNAGKNLIRFMLYQGSPAEGGATSKYSLTIPARDEAEAMAKAFRDAIALCAGSKT